MNKVLNDMRDEFNKNLSKSVNVEKVMETEQTDLPLENENKEEENNHTSTVGNANILSLPNSNHMVNTDNKNEVLKNAKVVVKRSSRRRPIGNNKSILQSAIARKEKSFSEYSKSPKKITRQVKTKIEDKKNGSTNMPSSILNKPLLDLVDNTNASRKKIKVVEPELNLQKESRLRRSQRTVSSDKEGTSKGLTNGELVKNYLDKHNLFRETSKLCCCAETKEIYSEIDIEPQFCSAIDSFGEKLIGCSKLVDVKTVPMLRPSTRIPFGVFCESHIQRLKRHNCCPNCGFFCTQGEFVQCNFKHYYHKECLLQTENMNLCPHCGDFTNNEAVMISMHSLRTPVFLPVQTPYQINCE